MTEILDEPAEQPMVLEYAGFWIRFVAFIIDWLISVVVSTVLYFVFREFYIDAVTTQWNNVLTIGLGLIYFAGMESSSTQATLGKMAVGVKVGNPGGERISFLNAVGRYCGKFVSAIILLFGYMMAGWTTRKQALHDVMADTVVFYAR